MFYQNYVQVTHDISVNVRPCYIEDESDVIKKEHVFVYFIEIENGGREPVQLLRRHWLITDRYGHGQEVHGDGVIGKQPVIKPGKVHKYNSYCKLETMKGTMEGYYEMRLNNEQTIKVRIPKFWLTAHLLN